MENEVVLRKFNPEAYEKAMKAQEPRWINTEWYNG